MEQLLFEGIGTHWKIVYEPSSNHSAAQISDDTRLIVRDFDTKYSRFKTDSLIWRIARSSQTEHSISSELADILSYGQLLKELTHGQFNPAVGFVLENLGYDTTYSFTEKSAKKPIHTNWRLNGRQLITPDPVLLDIGGWGKGYLIDLIAKYFKNQSVKHFLIDGGGDVYATSKPDGSPWRVALQHPTEEDQAFAMVELEDGAVASTGTKVRTFGQHHHLIDMSTKTSTQDLLGIHVLADTAAKADGAATAIFVSNQEDSDKIARSLNIEYLVIDQQLNYKQSSQFKGTLFSK